VIVIVERKKHAAKQSIGGEIERRFHQRPCARSRLSDSNPLGHQLDRPRCVNALKSTPITRRDPTAKRLMAPNNFRKRRGQSGRVERTLQSYRKADVISGTQPAEPIEEPEPLLRK
jgi:hypothetical protein